MSFVAAVLGYGLAASVLNLVSLRTMPASVRKGAYFVDEDYSAKLAAIAFVFAIARFYRRDESVVIVPLAGLGDALLSWSDHPRFSDRQRAGLFVAGTASFAAFHSVAWGSHVAATAPTLFAGFAGSALLTSVLLSCADSKVSRKAIVFGTITGYAALMGSALGMLLSLAPGGGASRLACFAAFAAADVGVLLEMSEVPLFGVPHYAHGTWALPLYYAAHVLRLFL